MMTHAHVTALCRNCQEGQIMAVEDSMEKANLYMFNLPQLFEKMEKNAKSEDERAYFAGMNVRRYAEDLYRVTTGTHDFIMTSVVCDNAEFEECREEFKRYMLLKIAEQKAQQLIQELFGQGNPTTPPEKKQPEDTSFNLLNSLDLPEDFFGRGVN
jgi:hypothetical protein